MRSYEGLPFDGLRASLSSAYRDLIEHRKTVAQALRTMGEDVGHMEVFRACDEEPSEASLEELVYNNHEEKECAKQSPR